MGVLRLSGSLTLMLCLLASAVWLGASTRAGGPLVGMPCPCDGVKGPLPKKVTLPLPGGRRMEGTCKDGKQDGNWTVWNQHGVKLRKTDYRKGVQHGMDCRWHENGRLASQEYYQNGTVRVEKSWLQTGEWAYYAEWDEKGDITYQVSWEKDGTLSYEVGIPPAGMPSGTPRRERDPIPPSVVRRADEYIVGKVGPRVILGGGMAVMVLILVTFHLSRGLSLAVGILGGVLGWVIFVVMATGCIWLCRASARWQIASFEKAIVKLEREE